ncbi:MAG: tetratricopeptide repeat protein [Deltaproteobacteria bacterium]|nr:tetratricopeptide repeat protein [Deltaproteobacteria bacterium]
MAAATTIGLAIGCTPPEERAQQTREAIAESIARGDRQAALEAIGDLQALVEATADAELELAGLMVRAGNAPEAGWLLEDAARRYPARFDVATALARVSLDLGNAARAREVAVGIPPGADEHPLALVLLAQAELGLGDLEGALATLAEAELLYPDRAEVRLARIATLYSEHRHEEARLAIEEARAALASDEEETAALRARLDVSLAQLLAQQGESEAAIAILEGMIESHPGDELAWRALLQVLAQQGRLDEALARLESALSANENLMSLRLLVAQVQVMRGEEEAAEAALRAYMTGSDSAAGVLPLVDFHSTRGDAAGARRVLDEALERYPDEARLSLLRIEMLLAEDEVDLARAELARFREATFDGDPQIEYLRARLELADGDAEAAADRLRELAPRLDEATTQYWLGRALEASGDVEGARRRYALAEQRDTVWPASTASLVALDERRGDWRAVVTGARKLVRLAPYEMDGWVSLVEALTYLGEGEAAEEVARRSLEVFPDRAEPHLLLAKALRVQMRTDEALAVLDGVPGSVLATERAVDRVLTLWRGGRVPEGIGVARAALDKEPEAAPLHAVLAVVLFAAGNANEGARETDRALALDPDEPGPLWTRCEYRAATGDWPGARDDCTRYVEARPYSASAQFMLGVAYQQLGDTEGAAGAYRRAAELDPRDLRSRNNLAELLGGQGDLEGALAVAQEAYRLDEQNPYLMDTLGVLYLRSGFSDRAISLLEEAHAGLPERSDVAFHLATAYREEGRGAEARSLLEQAERNAGPGDPIRPAVEDALRSWQ